MNRAATREMVESARAAVQALAGQLELAEKLEGFEAERWDGSQVSSPVLQIDDFSAIPFLVDITGVEEYQHRARLRDDARRFETWENSYALRAGLVAAIDYADAIGMELIENRVGTLAKRARKHLAQHPRISLQDIGRTQCGIVSFSIDGKDPERVVQDMSRAGFAIGTSTPASTRLDSERRNLPELLRIAPHYYNTEDEIDSAINHVFSLL